MANEVYGILYSNVHPISGDTYQSAALDEECFLREVISPIYQVLLKEVKRNKGGKASHSGWRNYDDLNEYFWSNRCFRLGWPMDTKGDFFRHSDVQPANERAISTPGTKAEAKTNLLDVRTFWHLYRSCDRSKYYGTSEVCRQQLVWRYVSAQWLSISVQNPKGL
ncbi:hypothetical protein SLA2020_381720 [Shorea laevis]